MASKLRILIPVKRVLDYAVKPRVNKTQTGIDLTGLKMSMNPFDDLSLAEAELIRKSSRHPAGVDEVIAFTCGPAKSAEVLRTAMAMGADRAIHVEVKDEEAVPEPLGVAKLLRAVVEREKINLVICGKQSIDDDAGQVGGMVAGMLGWGFANQARGVGFEGEGEGVVCVVEKEVDGGTETVRTKLPMVITTDLRLNEPKYATLPAIMKAKKKKIDKLSIEDLGVDVTRRLKVTKVIEPPPRQGGGKVDDVDGMVAKLKELGAI